MGITYADESGLVEVALDRIRSNCAAGSRGAAEAADGVLPEERER